MDHMKRREQIEQRYRELSPNAELVYTYVSLYGDVMNQQRDYGTGIMASMPEAHTLTLIADNPGITANEITKMWNRTKGAVSQNISKLEKKGLITRKRSDEDGRVAHIYVTEAGDRFVLAHKDTDNREIEQIHQTLSVFCTHDEIAHFYKVLSVLTGLMQGDQ